MNYSFILAMACVAMMVITAVIVLVVMLLKPNSGKSNDAGNLPADARRPARRSWQSWLIPIFIALILTIWSISAAISLLLIVWVLRLGPKENLSQVLTEEDQKICATNYRWVRNSSFFTVPVFIVALFMNVPPTIAGLIPFVFHISIIGRLKTKNLYVFRHTQQSLLLLILRAATASLIFSIFHLEKGFWPFILVNGSLWLFGTNWEISQVQHNTSWLMERKGEIVILTDIKNKNIVVPESPTIPPNETDEKMAQLISTMSTKEKQSAKERSLLAFRSGIQGEIRKNAVNILSLLGEVEKF